MIDDDEEDHEIFKEAIAEVDTAIDCVTVTSCDAGLNYLKANLQNLPGYIFLDLNMPKMNGKQCLEKLKKDKDLQNIPVVIYTTSYQAKDKEDTASLGASYFMTKPTSLKDLKKEVQSILTMEIRH